MGRLIDADALIEMLQKNMSNYIQDQIITENNINLIHSAPTAYDIEKVVAEFEEYPRSLFLKNEHGKVIGRMTTNTININDAIEIVRKGGVE
jgi:hypothetical protein